jgi:dTDP-4-dehydrorhamnose reductase
MGNPLILLLGASGQVGEAVYRGLGHVYAPPHAELDLEREQDKLRAVIRELRPSIVVNAAAYTQVDQAENNPVRARKLNTDLPKLLAEESQRQLYWLIHYSTDYVFDGITTRPYTENSPTAPLGVYGRTKLEGDLAIMHNAYNYTILRTGWVYGFHGHNFFNTMRSLLRAKTSVGVINDCFGTPTTSEFIADITHQLIQLWPTQQPTGLYNCVASGMTTWYRFTQEIIKHEPADQIKCTVINPISYQDYPSLTERPRFSVLNNSLLQKRLRITIPSWKQQLAELFKPVGD